MIHPRNPCPPPNPRTLRRARSPRGTVYVAVLGVTLLVTLIGVTGLLLTRVERRVADATHEAGAARLLARSALELGLLAARESGWRSSHTSGVWTAARPLGDGTVRYRFIDEIDGSLSDSASEPVRIEAEGVAGQAVRLLSANLVARPSDSAMTLDSQSVRRAMR